MKVLSTTEAAEKLNVSAIRVRQLIKAGRLPAQKVGRDYIIQEKDLGLVSDRQNGRPPKRERNGQVND
jgi:excisionase family DNA binding protein